MKRHAPATLRNREAIAAVLADELPPAGTVLEIASGSGEHAVFFAARFPRLCWQPSDPDPEAIASIAAYRADYPAANLAAPVMLDAARPACEWPVRAASAILCINMIHISRWEATEGLIAAAGQILSGTAGPLVLYGPFLEHGLETAPSNLAFDASLQARDPAWGLRRAEAVDDLAEQHGLARTARRALPAKNIALIYRPRR